MSLAVLAVALSVAIPFLIHLLPGGQAIGSTLLPIFWAPLLAAVLIGPLPAVAAAAAAPILNHAATGMPPTFLLVSLTGELVVFVSLVLLASRVRVLARSPLVAPVAYLAARWLVGTAALAFAGGPVDAAAPVASLGASAAGLVALFALNGLAVFAARGGERR